MRDSNTLSDPNFEDEMSQELFPLSGNRPLLYIIRYLFSLSGNGNRERDMKKRRVYSQIMRIILRETGETIMEHLLRYESATVYELVHIYNLPYNSVDRIMKQFAIAELVKVTGFMSKPYVTAGKRAKIYLLDGAHSSKAVEAQNRYAEILMSKRDETMRQTNIEEALNAVKLWMDERDIKNIPPSTHIRSILGEKEIKCNNLPLLTNRLVKKGYKF